MTFPRKPARQDKSSTSPTIKRPLRHGATAEPAEAIAPAETMEQDDREEQQDEPNATEDTATSAVVAEADASVTDDSSQPPEPSTFEKLRGWLAKEQHEQRKWDDDNLTAYRHLLYRLATDQPLEHDDANAINTVASRTTFDGVVIDADTLESHVRMVKDYLRFQEEHQQLPELRQQHREARQAYDAYMKEHERRERDLRYAHMTAANQIDMIVRHDMRAFEIADMLPLLFDPHPVGRSSNESYGRLIAESPLPEPEPEAVA